MKIIGLLCLVAAASCGPVVQEDSVVRLGASNLLDCANSDYLLCLKEQALRATEKLGTVRKLRLTDGITILNNSPKEARSLDALPAEPEERNKLVTERLWATASDLLQRSELELSFAGSEDEENDSRALNEVEESRGKKKKEVKKKLKMLIPLVILAKAKAIALVVLSLIVIAASIFKLAVLAKIAFIVKAISILKSLLAKKHQHHEEETWVPHVEEHGHGGHGGGGWESSSGWSRSKNDGGSLAYSAYRK